MTQALYELRHLRHGYGGRTVLDIGQLRIAGGEITALVGSNGAGKSTLLRLLARLEKPVSGEVLLAGRTLNSVSREAMRKIGWVMQQPYLFTGSALGNVILALNLCKAKKCRARALAALDTVGFDADPLMSVNELSGGQRQQVALARCLTQEPEILLLDEPFNHLDHRASRKLEELLQVVVTDKGGTVIFSSHDMEQSRCLADRMIALNAGRLAVPPCGNIFVGSSKGKKFESGKITILLPREGDWQHVVIDPTDIVLSRDPLDSSMRNRYRGEVVAIERDERGVRVSVLAGERFEVAVTAEAFREMGLTIGQPLWVQFKSTAIKVF